MSEANLNRGLHLLATVMSAVALTVVVTPAQAEAKPPCDQYHFPKYFSITQGSYQVKTTEWGGPTITAGRAWMYSVKDPLDTWNDGNITGEVKGRHVEFTIDWHGGSKGVYRGDVNSAGFARGTTEDMTHPGSRSIWVSNATFVCAPTPAPPPEMKPGPGRAIGKSPLFAKVIGEAVDVYDRPNEDERNPARNLGVLQVGTEVTLKRKCEPRAWCEVSGKAVPGGRGWVWGHLEFS